MAQKDNGWVDFTNVPDTPRSMRAWRALNGGLYLASSGNNRITLFNAEQTFDITPVTITDSIPVSITTNPGSPVITVNDAVNAPSVGKVFRFLNPISIGGIVLFGAYIVTGTGSGTYTFTAAQNAVSGAATGFVRHFSTVAQSPTILVAFPNHGLTTGQLAPEILVPVAVGGLTLMGNYIATVLGPSQYTISSTIQATSNQGVDENSGLLGLTFYAPASGGAQHNIPVSTTTSDNWGEFLLSCGRGAPVNVWMPGTGTSTPASVVATAPLINNVIFVSIQAQQLICLGTVNLTSGLFDPMLIRWSDTGDYTNFVPLPSDASGSFRLPIGSQLTAGLAMVGQNLIWSDLALYSMQYLGGALVWGFQPLGVNCGAVGPHAIGILANTVYWKSQNQFFVLGPSGPQQLECPVWDQVFPNQDVANAQNVVCETDSYYGEVGWSVPQIDGSVVFVRVRPDPTHGLAWTASTYHHHTAWVDQNVFGAPLGGHEDGLIDQHDTTYNANGAALPTQLTSGMILISEGSQTSFVRDFYPDIDWQGTSGQLSLSLLFYEYPESTPRVSGPFTITPTTTSVHPHGRARAFQIVWSGDDVNSNWRMGNVRYRNQADGIR